MLLDNFMFLNRYNLSLLLLVRDGLEKISFFVEVITDLYLIQ
jgi:hypothetical protein